ncbi:MAG TPA: glycosyltransferase, partial [Thermoanaerobaculia bacterium]|nr:glycosyltransferase [Thermoanaerobaculia bacterium]
QHVTFLDSKRRRDDIVARVQGGVASCGRHPAVLGYAVGNEIPPSIVRWYGRRRIERFVRRLYETAKAEHPDALVTYVNFPTTEYLELPFLDFFAWNVYLETPEALAAYVARLQNLAGEKPLLMTEIGLDSLRHGERRQAEVIDWQIRTVGDAGCAGAILFSWTDEWHRSGEEILDWRFGLTDRERRPKPALASAAQALDESLPPTDERHDWPLVSVVVCTYNGARTLHETLEALTRLDYPRYEVILVNDGSRDRTLKIAADYPVRVLTTTNRGLSHARNLGLRHALGEIVAYIDDDAYPHPHWLRYLVHTFMTTEHVGVGGPNVCPPTDGETAQCVSHSPGGPNHVLLSDTVAEHIPGCNMAFRRDALLAVGGFDERFRIAGDDVDVCWRLQESGGTLGYSPAAMVWHHSRGCIKGYLKQQYNYGRAEAMLELQWPAKYNSAGYPVWHGRVYGHGHRLPVRRRWRVYHGVWGSNLFQPLYMEPMGVLRSLPLLPESYLVIAALALVSAAGAAWPPLLWALPLLFTAVGVLVVQAAIGGARADLPWTTRRLGRWKSRGVISVLHLLQPVMRLWGRLGYGLHPLKRSARHHRPTFPGTYQRSVWSTEWRSDQERLERLERRMKQLGARVRRGGDFDSWDLEVSGGLLGGARLRMAIEEHGQGRQMARFKLVPALARWTLPLVGGFAAFGLFLSFFDNLIASSILAGVAALLGIRGFADCSGALSVLQAAVDEDRDEASSGA